MISAPRHAWRCLIATSLWLTLIGTGCGLALLSAQPAPTAPALPRGYVCYRTSTPLNIDGKLDEKAWLEAPWTDDFVDIEGGKKGKPRFRTRAKMLWDDQYFYIGAELEEPHVWATLTEHDAVIFHDNDFEVFINPSGDNHNYAEFEINALNTGWDLLLTKPYKDGGKPIDSWEIPGLKKAVHVDGTLNESGDRDRNWTVELAFPWKVLGQLATRPGAPGNGDQWRVNFSRVEWQIDIADGRYRKVPKTPEDNWVWSPQGIVDMHRPETWGYVQFSTAPFGKTAFRADVDLSTKQRLHEVYYAQRAFRKKNGRWAANLAELGPLFPRPAGGDVPTLEAGRFGFTASLPSLDKAGPAKTWQIRYDGLLWNSLEDERAYGADSKP
jgi:Carbohydrate family 9 binding domain-like